MSNPTISYHAHEGWALCESVKFSASCNLATNMEDQINAKLANYRKHNHHKIPAHLRSRGVLSIDLAGPFSSNVWKYKYILVACLTRIEWRPEWKTNRVPFGLNLKNREAPTVIAGVLSIINTINSKIWLNASEPNSNVAEQEVFRVHSDQGRELIAESTKQALDRIGVSTSVTQGYDPSSNGSSERLVGLIKSEIRKNLIQLQYDPTKQVAAGMWPVAANDAIWRLRQRIINTELLNSVPQFGEIVIARVKQTAKISSLINNFLCYSPLGLKTSKKLICIVL